MRFEIYLSIEGNCFDPVKFNGTLDKSIAGDVIHRQKIGGNRLNSDSALIYWRSTPCEVSDAEYPEDKLLKLVDSLTVDVQDLLKTMSVNVSVNIVEYLDATDTPRGVYFPSCLIKAVAQINANVDMDIVRDMT